MSDADRHRLRETFGSDAISYDRYRPGYPAPLFSDLARLADLRAGSRVLEIGPGTGQATVPLAGLGVRLVAVELSPPMAAVARDRLTGFEDVEIVQAAFEEWPLPDEAFDLVVSATAFHWVDPEVRMQKSARALRAGGMLAVVSTHHVRDAEYGFFDDVQACYRRFDPDTPLKFRLPRADEIPQDPAELLDGGWFEEVTFRRYKWEHVYDANGYVNLLSTYSNHIALPADARSGLLRCVGNLIDSTYGGAISKRYLTQLAVARRNR